MLQSTLARMTEPSDGKLDSAGFTILTLLTFIDIRDIFVANNWWRGMNQKPDANKSRMIHVRLPEDLHKKVRIRAAETDKTIQDWVVETIQAEIECHVKARTPHQGAV